MDDEQHDRISQLAHELWEKEGRPEGKDAEHWQAAKRLIETNVSESATGQVPATAPGEVRLADGNPEPEVSNAAAALD